MTRSASWRLRLAVMLSMATLALMLLAVAPPVHAQETLLEYGTDVHVLADGTLEITDTLRVRAEGHQVRRGITRSFPTRYHDRLGNAVRVDFTLLGIERDGHTEPGFIERVSNGVVINTGNDDMLPVPGVFTYTLRYRTTRQLGFFEDFDELYYNAIPHGSTLPVERAWVRVHLPADVPREQLRLTAYSGAQGARGQDWTVAVENPRTIRFDTQRRFAPGEGLTVVVGLPKGLVRAPDAREKAWLFLRDNAGIGTALASLLALLAFYYIRWNAVGRDPHAGPVFPRYAPPADLCPGEVRTLLHMRYDTRAFAADVLAMAVAGALDIDATQSDWRLTRRDGFDTGHLPAPQRTIASELFAAGGTVTLKDSNASLISGARSSHQAIIRQRLVPSRFINNGGTVAVGVLASLVLGLVSAWLAAGDGTLALLVIGGLTLIAHLVFAFLLKAPTREGRVRLDEIEGLRMYLSVAERDEIAAMDVPGPQRPVPTLDVARYEMLLPYAMALDVESEWASKFTAAVGVRDTADERPDWYHDTGRPDYAALGSQIGTALSSHIASAATPPGDSSGGGGGGSSGGGGGGGGVGGR